MATYEKKYLFYGQGSINGYSDGRPIPGANNNLHFVPAGATYIDEVWLWVTNQDSTNIEVTLTLDDSFNSSTLQFMSVTVPAKSNFLLLSGFCMGKSADPLANMFLIGGSPSGSGLISYYGYVNRITP